MTYLSPFLRLVAIGTIYGVEDFTWSLSLIPDFNNPPFGEPEEVPAAVIAAVQTFHGASKVTSAQCRLTAIKLNLIGEDGRYVNDETVLHEFAPPYIAGGATGVVPAPQVACAVSLETAKSRGRAARGRFYVPLPGMSQQTDGRYTAVDALAMATAATTMIESLNAAVPGFTVGVTSNIGTGAANPVVRVKVGRVPDVIRSRREKFDEDYQTAPDVTA